MNFILWRRYILCITLFTYCDCPSNYFQLWLMQIVFWNHKLYNNSPIRKLLNTYLNHLQSLHSQNDIHGCCEITSLCMSLCIIWPWTSHKNTFELMIKVKRKVYERKWRIQLLEKSVYRIIISYHKKFGLLKLSNFPILMSMEKLLEIQYPSKIAHNR